MDIGHDGYSVKLNGYGYLVSGKCDYGYLANCSLDNGYGFRWMLYGFKIGYWILDELNWNELDFVMVKWAKAWWIVLPMLVFVMRKNMMNGPTF